LVGEVRVVEKGNEPFQFRGAKTQTVPKEVGEGIRGKERQHTSGGKKERCTLTPGNRFAAATGGRKRSLLPKSNKNTAQNLESK